MYPGSLKLSLVPRRNLQIDLCAQDTFWYRITKISSEFSRLSVSQHLLPRIPLISKSTSGPCLNMKIYQQCNKILWKRGSNFSSIPQYFQYISDFRSQITYSFVKCGCSIYIFLSSTNFICRGTGTSKYFRVSLGLRDNESRLYSLYLKLYWNMNALISDWMPQMLNQCSAWCPGSWLVAILIGKSISQDVLKRLHTLGIVDTTFVICRLLSKHLLKPIYAKWTLLW